jgi:hypothetical protein
MTWPSIVFACVVSAAVAGGAAAATPKRLAIFYGIPSLVNDAGGDAARAAAVFADYDLVVFGDGLEFDDVVRGRKPAGAGAVEYRRTREIMARLAASARATAVFGYVDLGRSQQLAIDDIAARVGRWKTMGAAGIFYDEAGSDFGVNRERQNAALEAAHRAGLRVVLNAFDPDDVFAPREARGNTRLGPGDAYLLESFAVRNGVAEDPRGWNDRLGRAKRGAAETGAGIWATTTAGGRFTPELMGHAWSAAVTAGLDAFAWGEPSFSSADSRLPFRPRPR